MVLLQIAFRCLEKYFEDKSFLKSKIFWIFWISCILEVKQEMVSFLAYNFRQGCQNCILPVQRNILGCSKNFFPNANAHRLKMWMQLANSGKKRSCWAEDFPPLLKLLRKIKNTALRGWFSFHIYTWAEIILYYIYFSRNYLSAPLNVTLQNDTK